MKKECHRAHHEKCSIVHFSVVESNAKNQTNSASAASCFGHSSSVSEISRLYRKAIVSLQLKTKTKITIH